MDISLGNVIYNKNTSAKLDNRLIFSPTIGVAGCKDSTNEENVNVNVNIKKQVLRIYN
jgi:hypothetical protein